MSGLPILDVAIDAALPGLIRRWTGVAGAIDQPLLDHHYVSLHLGGPKRLKRVGEGRTLIREALPGAYSVIPAGTAFRWDTEGAIDFAHLYLAPKVVDDIVLANFERDPATFELQDVLAARDPLAEILLMTLMEEVANPDGARRGLVDEILHLFVHRLLLNHASLSVSQRMPGRYTLSPFRLKRARDFIEANLSVPIGVADIAGVVGVSPFHFSRAFRQATGFSPYAYLIRRRILLGRTLLRTTPMSVAAIAQACGFSSLSQFSRAFKRSVGIGPQRFRG